MSTDTQRDSSDVRNLRGAVLAVWACVGVGVLGAAAFVLGSHLEHDLKAWLAWAVAAAVAAGAVQADRMRHRRQGRHLRLGVAVADGLLAVTALPTVLLIVAVGSWAALIGAWLSVLLLVEWLARHRSAQGHWDGPALLILILGSLTYGCAQRPWTPSSGQWQIATFVAAVATALALASLKPARRRTD